MLILARRLNETIMIGDQIEVSIVDIRGDQVKLGIKAPPSVKVYRQEVYRAIQQENQAAASASPSALPPLADYVGRHGGGKVGQHGGGEGTAESGKPQRGSRPEGAGEEESR